MPSWAAGLGPMLSWLALVLLPVPPPTASSSPWFPLPLRHWQVPGTLCAHWSILPGAFHSHREQMGWKVVWRCCDHSSRERGSCCSGMGRDGTGAAGAMAGHGVHRTLCPGIVLSVLEKALGSPCCLGKFLPGSPVSMLAPLQELNGPLMAHKAGMPALHRARAIPVFWAGQVGFSKGWGHWPWVEHTWRGLGLSPVLSALPSPLCSPCSSSLSPHRDTFGRGVLQAVPCLASQPQPVCGQVAQAWHRVLHKNVFKELFTTSTPPAGQWGQPRQSPALLTGPRPGQLG